MAIRSWLKHRVATRSRSTRQQVPATPRQARLSPRAPSRLAPGLTSWGRTTVMGALLPQALTSVNSVAAARQRLDHSDQLSLATVLAPGGSRTILDSPGILLLQIKNSTVNENFPIFLQYASHDFPLL